MVQVPGKRQDCKVYHSKSNEILPRKEAMVNVFVNIPKENYAKIPELLSTVVE